MKRLCLGSLLFLLLLGPGVLEAPASPVPSEAPSLAGSDAERLLSACLQPPPPGYVVSPQRHQRQRVPVPVTPAQWARLLFPYSPELAGRTMGWVVPDREYVAGIPWEAKVLPADLSALPVLRFNNLEIHGEREVRWRSTGEYDQWFLHDATRRFDAVMAIHRETRRVYFFEYGSQGGRRVYRQSKESCYSCHASGPRLVRTYTLEKVDAARLAEFNRKLLSYGAADFGDSIDPARLGPALDDARCAGCHDGRTRGHLYAMNLPTVGYYLQTLRAMPPGAPLSPTEAENLIATQFRRYEASQP
jgi:hypothetical protein